jgi:hypothetical protein
MGAMWTALLVALAQPLVSALPQSRETPVAIVGEYSNMEFTEEHAYGYTAQLWRQGDRVFGLFEASEGLAGDTPAGMLDEVQFDPRSGALSFKAKLSIGVVLQPSGRQEPSRDLFEFRGTLERTALVGTLRQWDMRQPQGRPVTRQVRLQKQSGASRIQASTYAEWKKSADEILKFRGPKW